MEKVCVQGLGFVGLAMSIALASARTKEGDLAFNVVGIDLPTPEGKDKINKINTGIMPIKSTDEDMGKMFDKAIKTGNLRASSDCKEFANARVILVDINLDVDKNGVNSTVNFSGLKKAIESISANMDEDALVIVETTVPPGTTENVVLPIIETDLRKRFGSHASPLVAHSYERVMPGPNYINSIKNFWRVYATNTEEAAKKTEEFYEKFVNTKKYPMTRLESPRSSETAKILENSYRAMNIAFIQEWTEFAEKMEVDLFSVLDVIQIRPTHSNIRRPGLGVGGYCLTKDPLMGLVSSKEFLREIQEFPLSVRSVEINDDMPKYSVKLLLNHFKGNINGKKILIAGASYRCDVGDFRNSSAIEFANKCISLGGDVILNDPYIDKDIFMSFVVDNTWDNLYIYDAIILCVGHTHYKAINIEQKLSKFKGLILDTNEVLARESLKRLKSEGSSVLATGRGDI